MGLFKSNATNQPSARKAGDHTHHLPRGTVENAKKVVPKNATPAELRSHARDLGDTVKGRAKLAVHHRSVTGFNRKNGN
jgi:hypothetical protein